MYVQTGRDDYGGVVEGVGLKVDGWIAWNGGAGVFIIKW
jgi:hypothetical protein